MTRLRRMTRGLGGRWLPLVCMIPVAYLLRPVFWDPLDDRFYDFFHSLRPVSPWTRVAIAGVDEVTRDSLPAPPVLPLSRHVREHAQVVRRAVAYEASETLLASGGLLCLYTDGVTEARNPAGEEYGVDRLQALLAGLRLRPAAEIGQAILEGIRGFSRLERQAGDATLVILRVAVSHPGA